MAVSEKTKQEVYDRDAGCCVLCGTGYNLERTPHHCFFKSEYHKDDRDDEWNLVMICMKDHDVIHKGGESRTVKELSDKYCKYMAYKRYDGDNKDELDRIMKKRGYIP